eukprot:1514047-Pyramimonas_sp.AAC.1
MDVPKLTRVRMRTLPLEPSVELLTVPRNVWRVCRDGSRYAREPCHRGLRWSSRWGHEAGEGRVEMNSGTRASPAATACDGTP